MLPPILLLSLRERGALARRLSLSKGSDGGSTEEVTPAIILSKSAPPTPTTKSPVLGFLGGLIDYVSHSRMLMFWLMFAGLAMYFTVHYGLVLLSRFSAEQNVQVAHDGNEGQRQLNGTTDLPAAPLRKTVARLTKAIDCHWTFPRTSDGTTRLDQPGWNELPVGTEFTAGQRLNLSAGLAELTFDSGAKVILHAPVQFAVSETLGGDLQLGKLTAKVPHSAHGFTINTPGGRVVDLGTEFGVTVNSDRTLHVIVYVGDVEVNELPDAGGKTRRAIHVHAGEAIVLSPGHPVQSVDPKDEWFIRDISALDSQQKSEAAYLGLMKELKPAVWFRMEGNDSDRVIHDEMGAAPDGELYWDGPGNPFEKGRVGKGLWLRGPELQDYALVPDYPKADKGRLSVVAWVYADEHAYYAGIAKNWGDHGRGQFEFTLIGDDRTHEGDLGLYFAQANGQEMFFREGKEHPLPLHQWQHVAFTTDGSTMRLYREGREVASLKHNGLHYPVKQKSLGIGVKIGNDDKTPSQPPSYWSGKIDELAIFNDTLSPEDIRRLANAPPQ